MKVKRIIPCFVFLVALVAACSHAPRLDRDADATADFRAEYLEHNAHNEFTERIMRGEVDKGMNAMQVLAAWGLPNVRRSWQDSDAERWTYYTLDEYTSRLTSYELVFAGGYVARWLVDANVRGLGTLTPKDLIAGGTIHEVTETPATGLAQGTGPIKK